LEGFPNSTKLTSDDDKLELRIMDELFILEKEVGEIRSIINFIKGDFESLEEDIIYEKKEIEEPPEEVVKLEPKEGEEGEEAEVEEPVVEGKLFKFLCFELML
jgi:hypothetical protein